MSFRLCLMFASALVVPISPCSAQDDAPPEVRWEEFRDTTRDGRQLQGRLGRIDVPENRERGGDATIELAFVVYESTSSDPGPPIFFLIGGPGAPGIAYTAQEALEPHIPLIEFGDVVGIDQRGTGLSRPNLSTEEFSFELPLDEPLTRAALIEAQSDAIERCYRYWSDEGVDLAAYNTRESADDVDAVRRALGYDRIITWGTSYGSHLSLAYLRRHAEHVDRAVVMKVEGPNDTFKLPARVQARLEAVNEYVAADPVTHAAMPDLLGTLTKLLQQLEEEPVSVTLAAPTGDIDVRLGPYDLRCAIALQVAHTQTLAQVPAVLQRLANGDWTPLGMAALNLRFGGVDSAMAVMMDYASGATPARLAEIERQTRDPKNLLSDALSFPYYPASASACGNPDLGDAFRAPFECDLPVLFVSGDLDARTPAENVEELLPGFPNAAHVLVRGTGHDSRELESEDYCDLVKAFLFGEEVPSSTIELEPLRFVPLGR